MKLQLKSSQLQASSPTLIKRYPEGFRYKYCDGISSKAAATGRQEQRTVTTHAITNTSGTTAERGHSRPRLETSTLHLRTVHTRKAHSCQFYKALRPTTGTRHPITRRTRPSRARPIPSSPHAPRLSPQRPHERGGSDGAAQVCASRAHASPCLSSRARLPGVRPAASRALTEPPALMRCWMHFTCPRAAAQ